MVEFREMAFDVTDPEGVFRWFIVDFDDGF
jgi:hypothetical protein